MNSLQDRREEREIVLEHLYDMLFQAWPLMRRKLLPSPMQQAEFGMPLSHMQVLAMLDHHGSLSITEISNRFGIAKPNITPLVDRLIEDGLVMRERNSADRRVVNVVICEEGRRRLSMIYRKLCDQLFDWTHALDDEELRAFIEALETIVRLLGAQLDG